MIPENAVSAAEFLIALRSEGRVATSPPDGLEPGTVADGYRIQEAFLAGWPHPQTGWKIGATAAAVQERFGLSEPFCGPFFGPNVYASPARPVAGDFPHLCLESEFAFRFARALPAREATYARAEIAEAIDAVIPAIELVGPRFDSLLFGHAAMAIADCGMNAGFVLGEPVLDWQTYDLPNHPVVLRLDGEVVAEGCGANVLGDPMAVLEWTVNHLSERGIGVGEGMVVSTGTMTGLVHVLPDQDAVADFGSLGQVAVTFTGAAHRQNVSKAG